MPSITGGETLPVSDTTVERVLPAGGDRSAPACRLLYLVGELHTGGLERQLYYLLKAMDRERYRPAVAIWNYRADDFHVAPIRALDVPLYGFPMEWSSAVKLKAFRRLVRELAPEVVHASTFYINFAAYAAAVGTRAIAVGSVRGDFLESKAECGPLVGRLSARWPREQISNNFAARDRAGRSPGLFGPGQWHVVQNGLDLAAFDAVPVSPDGPAVIAAVGYLLPAKRWERLLAAAAILNRRGLEFSIRIAGDGPLLEDLKAEARRLGVANRVEFAGHVDDVPRFLRQATFVVHTAEHEGCPNAVMEAMACRRAVVATDAGDVPRLVANGRTGFVVRRGDDAGLADRMVTLIRDRSLCRRMGDQARAKAENEFGLDRLVSETLAAYRAAGWEPRTDPVSAGA
jgi:glycosyltransferase involved in cell wall biosynthesis